MRVSTTSMASKSKFLRCFAIVLFLICVLSAAFLVAETGANAIGAPEGAGTLDAERGIWEQTANWRKEPFELRYEGKKLGHDEERFSYDDLGRLKEHYVNEKLRALFSYPSEGRIIETRYDDTGSRTEELIYLRDEAGALISRIRIAIAADKERGTQKQEQSSVRAKVLTETKDKDAQKSYFAYKERYLVIADSLLALNDNSLLLWDKDKLISSSETRVLSDKLNKEEKRSLDADGIGIIESYDQLGRLERKLYLKDAKIFQEDLWVYEGKLLQKHLSKTAHSSRHEVYAYDADGRLIRVAYYVDDQLTRVKDLRP